MLFVVQRPKAVVAGLVASQLQKHLGDIATSIAQNAVPPQSRSLRNRSRLCGGSLLGGSHVGLVQVLGLTHLAVLLR